MPGLTLFTVGEMVRRAGVADFGDVVDKGAVLLVTIKFACNLDEPLDVCRPEFVFNRVDPPAAPGFSYRYEATGVAADNVTAIRNLFKVFGVRVLFRVYGRAGRFNMVGLLQAIGASLTLIGVASLLTDLVRY